MKYIVTIARILLSIDLRSFRPEWFSALSSDSPISGHRGTIHRSHLHFTFLYRRLSDSADRWLVHVRQPIRPVRAAPSWPGARQHS